MIRIYFPILFSISLSLSNTICFSQITGQIWSDENTNGIKEVTENAHAQVSAVAHDWLGKLVASTVTDKYGAYLLDVPAEKKVRVSFGNLPEGLIVSGKGANIVLAQLTPI